VRARIHLIPFLLTAQSARLWELGTKKSFCYKVGAHQLETTERGTGKFIDRFLMSKIDVTGHEKGTGNLAVFQERHFHGK